MDLTTSPDPGSKADATELHRYAEALLVSLSADGNAPSLPPGVTDVPGYWLAPAVEALGLIISGQDALEPLALAAELDEQRTSLFLCLSLAVCGLGDRIHASWLGTAFGELSNDRPVTSGQRALWLAAARGAYGPVGKIFVLRKLDAVVVPPEDELWLKALVPDEPTPVVPTSLDGFPELAAVPEIATSAQAVARLRRLRERCSEITSAPRPAEVSKVVSGTVWTDDEPLAVLRSLAGQETTEGPLSSLSGHLLHDVRPVADPHLAALALHVAAPAVKAAAESLVETIQAPPPGSVTVPILGYPITLSADGPDQLSMTSAEQRIVTDCVTQGSTPWPGYLVGAVAAVVFVVGFVVSFLLTVAGAALGGWSGYLVWRHRMREQADLRRVQARVGELSDAAERGVRTLREYGKEAAARSETAAEDLAELCRVLRRGPRAA
ncbi:hypothetical protein GCM10023194_78840 [Planotetraspora phitsanulokensis]|uniref:Uncharacterized protein n=1 Tax=Planotetraspora phitsanulokensis TaxID=575192 RepID=A0A8J3UIU0_9ACTN|nr:hypothetical protein [Planotetraspora phitsanulokensis]GII43094.1 hypothetical protein Pph01_80970 [Planotetraspora phitsanulokensis]